MAARKSAACNARTQTHRTNAASSVVRLAPDLREVFPDLAGLASSSTGGPLPHGPIGNLCKDRLHK